MSLLTFNILSKSLSRLQIKNTNKILSRDRGYLVQPRLRNPWWYQRKFEHKRDDYITPENKEFINEFTHDKYGQPTIIRGVQTYENASPLNNMEKLEPRVLLPFSKRAGLIGRKIGDYPLYSKEGKRILTTLIQVLDNHVIKYIPPEEHIDMNRVLPEPKKKLGCLLVGAESVDPSQITADYAGLFKDSGVMPKKIMGRFLITPDAMLPPGTPLFASHFQVGDRLNIRGRTIYKGFQGVVIRWGFKGQPATHGSTKTHRRPGNIGGGGEKGRVWPGTKLPGHMGHRVRHARGVQILRINKKYNVIWVKGVGIPGPTNSICFLSDTKYRPLNPIPPPPFPTYFPSEDEEEEILHETLHDFKSPSITFTE